MLKNSAGGGSSGWTMFPTIITSLYNECLCNIGHFERLFASCIDPPTPKSCGFVCKMGLTDSLPRATLALVNPHLQPMSANQPIPFLHHRVTYRHTLIESVCPGCGDFVGASSDEKNLMIAEAAHACDCTDERRAVESKPPRGGATT